MPCAGKQQREEWSTSVCTATKQEKVFGGGKWGKWYICHIYLISTCIHVLLVVLSGSLCLCLSTPPSLKEISPEGKRDREGEKVGEGRRESKG